MDWEAHDEAQRTFPSENREALAGIASARRPCANGPELMEGRLTVRVRRPYGGGTLEANETTVELLKQIRDESRKTNERIESLESTLGKRIESVEFGLERIECRQTESEVRIATELVAVAHAVDKVRDLLAARNEIGDKVVDHEKRISDLERRLGS